MWRVKWLVLIALTFILVACGGKAEISSTVEASNEDIFEVIGKDSFSGLSIIYELKHIETGCHYTITYVGDAGSIEQMYIEDEDGNVIPYCD